MRGSGKTGRLLRGMAKMGRRTGLSPGFSPVVSAEQSDRVGITEEFQLEVLSRLAPHAPHREDASDPHHTPEDVHTIRND